jgi:hypothetical protein
MFTGFLWMLSFPSCNQPSILCAIQNIVICEDSAALSEACTVFRNGGFRF